MTIQIDVEKLPRNILENAIKLNDPLKNIYITLYCIGQPTAPKDIAKKLGHARAYVHMRLCQLETMGLAKKIYEKNRVKFKALY